MYEHIVSQGECFATIAARYGFSWRTLWEHPDNEQLRSLRQSPNVLYPGDIVIIPERKVRKAQVQAGEQHRFVLRLDKAWLHLRLVEFEEPLANVSYTLELEGEVLTGITDGDGKLKVKLPRGASSASARLTLEGRRDEYVLLLGHIDPVTEVSGLQARLRNLGFYREVVDGRMSPATVFALREFQQVHGLEPTGAPDARTRDALVDTYGC